MSYLNRTPTNRRCRLSDYKLALALWFAFGFYLWWFAPGEQVYGFWRNVAFWGAGVLLS